MNKPEFNKLPIAVQYALFEEYDIRDQKEMEQLYNKNVTVTFLLNLVNRVRQESVNAIKEIDEFFRKLN